jgi:hypothetical protein
VYCKGPGGWFASAWHGQFVLGRAERPFDQVGIEVKPNHVGWTLGFDSGTQMLGKIVGFPLWFPLPIVGALAFAAAWRAAVRRALALHWREAPVDQTLAGGER